MRLMSALIASLGLVLSAGTLSAADGRRTTEIRERLYAANDWRGHVMVVAHRTGWKEKGVFRFPDNSLSGIRNAIALGAEMVELDVRRTADGVPVLMHDEYLDRTTTCRGQIARYTYAALSTCKLVLDGSRTVTEEAIPRLEDAFLTTRDHILVNVDNKLDAEALPGIAALARRLGMPEQIVIKQNVWDDRQVERMRAVLERTGHDIPFMPILADDAVHDARFMSRAARSFSAPAAELVHWHADGAPMTVDGGPLFSAKARAAAIKGNWHLWVDIYPIVNRADGMLAGGRGDGLAAIDPEKAYGFWIDHGVTIIQTDEPKAAIRWLSSHGYRMPYAADAPQAMAEKAEPAAHAVQPGTLLAAERPVVN